jgi:NAD(P)-dependent dehydrogenase (short-subunit alcohol dehydrogenase family)
MIDFHDLQSERSYDPVHTYCCTKLANVLFTYELADQLSGTRVTANCLHPGSVATNLLADLKGRPRLFCFVQRLKNLSPTEGAQTSLYLATSPDVQDVSGKYFVRQQPTPSSDISYDKQVAQTLWQLSAELNGL